jgi:archaeosine-15-forming tRNA-guanine transglycosylase
MVEKIRNEGDFKQYLGERELSMRLREAIGFCKNSLELGSVLTDRKLKPEDRVAVERCLTENYLLKKGMDYFGKRDLIYIDLFGTDDVNSLRASQI